MGAYKGQNLRVFMGGKVIAGATSCTVHLAAQVEDASTKDSPDGWAVNECTGLSWDVATDALVFADTLVGRLKWSGSTSDKSTISSVVHYHIGPGGSENNIDLTPGSSIILESDEVTSLSVLGNSRSSVFASGTGRIVYKNETNNTQAVTPCCSGTNHTGYVTVSIKDANDLEDMLAAIDAGTKVTIQFSVVSGADHRTISQTLRQGQAYVTDLNVTATNRANGTYSTKFTGTGPFAAPV